MYLGDTAPSMEKKLVNGYGPYLYLVWSFRNPETGRPQKRRRYLGRVSDIEKKR